MPAPALVLGAALSVQFGAALAKTLFDDAGPAGTVLLRAAFAAIVLLLLWRPRVERAGLAPLLLFGVSLAGMNLAFYESIDRIPLGAAVTIEFSGPLLVAVAGSRRALDLVWVALAAAGILLLSAPGTGGLEAAGVGFAFLAAAFWALYIVVAARTTHGSEGGSDLAVAMAVAALLLIPFGVPDGGSALVDPEVLAIGFGVAMLSSAIPYSLEFEALRRMPQNVFGVLMSLEPALAALAGFLILDQAMSARDAAGIALVIAASVGAARDARTPPPLEA